MSYPYSQGGPYNQQAPPFPGQGYPPPPQQGGYPTYPQGGYPAPGFQAPPPNQGFGGAPPPPGFQVPNQDMYGGTDTSYKDPEMDAFEFSDKTIRRGFIRKVYSILSVQLAISLVFIGWFVYDKRTQHLVSQNRWLLIVAIITIFVTMIALACCGEVRRKAPTNFIFLGIFTIAESFVLAVGASAYKSEEVFMAVGITAVVCLGLTIFAFQTKYDFTMIGGFLFVAVLILMVFGLVTIFVRGKTISMIYASLGALIFSIYLIYDTQLMMGGQHKFSISPEEYVFAALNLYLDIINIFMYILTIIGSSRD